MHTQTPLLRHGHGVHCLFLFVNCALRWVLSKQPLTHATTVHAVSAFATLERHHDGSFHCGRDRAALLLTLNLALTYLVHAIKLKVGALHYNSRYVFGAWIAIAFEHSAMIG